MHGSFCPTAVVCSSTGSRSLSLAVKRKDMGHQHSLEGFLCCFCVSPPSASLLVFLPGIGSWRVGATTIPPTQLAIHPTSTEASARDVPLPPISIVYDLGQAAAVRHHVVRPYPKSEKQIFTNYGSDQGRASVDRSGHAGPFVFFLFWNTRYTRPLSRRGLNDKDRHAVVPAEAAPQSLSINQYPSRPRNAYTPRDRISSHRKKLQVVYMVAH